MPQVEFSAELQQLVVKFLFQLDERHLVMSKSKFVKFDNALFKAVSSAPFVIKFHSLKCHPRVRRTSHFEA